MTRKFDERNEVIDKIYSFWHIVKWASLVFIPLILIIVMGFYLGLKSFKTEIPGNTHILSETLHSTEEDVTYNTSFINGDTLTVTLTSKSTYWFKGLSKENKKTLIESLK